MKRISTGSALVVLGLLILASAGCGSDKIIMLYADEEVDFQGGISRTPALYIDMVMDMRPVEQRTGQGHFFGITYPKDEAWSQPANLIYAEALAQDVEQTHLFELVPLQAQADYVLSANLLSLGCRLERSPMSFLLAGIMGGAVGVVLGDDSASKAKMAGVMAGVGILAIPMPTRHVATAEVQLTLRDNNGQLLWRETCIGEVRDKSLVGLTARKDQELVNKYLAKAVKRCNGCLLMQLRQKIVEMEPPTG